MDNEVTYYKTWYKYPEIKPSELDDYNTYKDYEVYWHWNKGSHIDIQYIDNEGIQYNSKENCWKQTMWDENTKRIVCVKFEKPRDDGYCRVVTAWSEITYPKFNDD